MLNGLDPLFIFQFSKLALSAETLKSLALSDVPLESDWLDSLVEMPPIPLPLNEKITGIYVQSEDMHTDIDIDLVKDVKSKDAKAKIRLINDTVTINMLANKNSVGVTILTALNNLITPMTVNQEYSVSYFHNAIAIFGGLIRTFSVVQKSDSELLEIKLELTKTNLKKQKSVEVLNPTSGTTPLSAR